MEEGTLQTILSNFSDGRLFLARSCTNYFLKVPRPASRRKKSSENVKAIFCCRVGASMRQNGFGGKAHPIEPWRVEIILLCFS